MSYSSKEVPQGVKRWNWGAFMFNIIWGFGNKSYLPLLMLIPVFNLIWMFVCGFKGNEWAWKNGDYDSEKTFMKVQETWNRAGLIYFIISVVFSVVFFLFFFSTMMAMLAGIASQGQY
ncbi:ribonuclease G [Providencia rettgeri]|uniref:Ribonuclease G n=1 Tax=Providencia stuartii TaxID=588 RepID=A0AAI9GIM0_PROST|nr:ribonuclease G [Providencia stuartii]ELR5115259.1 ribonuclease G [Providencia stuartii]MDV5227911.1 ribonuclease G [Providencia rettgeri]